jgi:murein DD-endopeptidase MepM/ murein hydrolase activator NlpD
VSFLLSLLGYGVAWLAYSFFGTDMTLLGYSYIGYNFILGAIAIGGYFYIPSKQSFFWAFAITPITALVSAGLFVLLKPFNLSLFSLPFNLILLTFIYAFRFRTVKGKFREVLIQEGTPERNLYSYQSFIKRFPNFGWFQIKLPFLGEWYVAQGQDGGETHKGEWGNAWDFVIVNSELSQYEYDGSSLKDYYCWGQNVIAPAGGSVVIVEDGIEDNNIGQVNTYKNWGNTVIIKHSEGLYSKLCHLQKGSVSVKIGDNVHYGQVVGKVGNSGRSPYPHLHFQIQSTPYIGSKTIKYPLFAYLEDGKELETFSYPAENHKIKPVEENLLLKKAFNLMPGTKLNWNIIGSTGSENASWEVFTSPYNKSYIFCHTTKSTAWFLNDGVHFYFTHFDGSRKSLLYLFYLAAFRIPLVNIESFTSTDSLPVNQTFSGLRLFIHDFTAPFFLYLKADIKVRMKRTGSEFDLEKIGYSSELTGNSFSKIIWSRSFKIDVNSNNSLRFEDKQSELEAICESY